MLTENKKGESQVELPGFADFDLPAEIMHAISDLEYETCTPIQAEIIPKLLEGSDAAGRAQTGTGKTAAFLIAIFTYLLRNPPETNRKPGTPRVLILAPTRELALQIEKEAQTVAKYCEYKLIPIIGGIDYGKQKSSLESDLIDVIVATPGRLLDFKRSRTVDLRKVEILVIDEADRMLDMGFIPDVRNIIYSTPQKGKRQTLLFSATLSPDIMRIADSWMDNPVTVEIDPGQVTVDTIDQIVYITSTADKFVLLYNLIVKNSLKSVIVFGNRRDETESLVRRLRPYGINCALLSGAVSQAKRLRTLEDFRNGKIDILVATDVAGRGIHIDLITHVINFTLPDDPDAYVHRIGRTGRAGELGTSISFACEEDSFAIPAIEEYIGHELKCVRPPEDLLEPPPPVKRNRNNHSRRTDRK